PPAAPKEAATPVVPASAKRLNADPEIMTSRLRPRAGRADAIASAPVPATPSRRPKKDDKHKTYSSRDSHVVTHRSTNLPFNCLCMAERTGCPVFS
ncbi:hypothetical protein KCU73_g17884, partial [Aureobasidium melanogenum]